MWNTWSKFVSSKFVFLMWCENGKLRTYQHSNINSETMTTMKRWMWTGTQWMFAANWGSWRRPKSVWFKQHVYIFGRSSWGWKSKIKVLAALVSGEAALLGVLVLSFPLCPPHTGFPLCIFQLTPLLLMRTHVPCN